MSGEFDAAERERAEILERMRLAAPDAEGQAYAETARQAACPSCAALRRELAQVSERAYRLALMVGEADQKLAACRQTCARLQSRLNGALRGETGDER